MPFATGKYSIAFCDRCDRRVRYTDLRPQVVNEIVTNLLVCPECLDVDHPQLQVGKVSMMDPQALENARPDKSLLESRGLFGWNPVLGQQIGAYVGAVTVSVI